MKLITTIIRRQSLEQVKAALSARALQGLIVYEVTCHGGRTDHTEVYKGAAYAIDFASKIKVEILAPDELEDFAVGVFEAVADNDEGAESPTLVMDVSHARRTRSAASVTPRAA